MTSKSKAIKICGLKNLYEIQYVSNLKANFIGLVFYPSSTRYISPIKAGRITKLHISSKTPSKLVSVIVNPSILSLNLLHKYFKSEYIQIHNLKNPSILKWIAKKFHQKIILAISSNALHSLDSFKKHQQYIDYILIDAPTTGKQAGGIGKKFNWDILKQSNFNPNKPWFLSGGLNINNIEEAISQTNARNYDLSSGVEIKKGSKSLTLINNLMQKFHKIKDN